MSLLVVAEFRSVRSPGVVDGEDEELVACTRVQRTRLGW
jgi:hypothetical protein